MSARRIIRSNSTAKYVIALVVIIVAFLLLGGGPWVRNFFHGSFSSDIANWNWVLILICLAIGFVLGIGYSRRR